MRRNFLLPIATATCVLAALASGCASSHSTSASSSSDSTLHTVSQVRPDTLPWKFSLFISGSGVGDKPQDAWTLDTSGMMGVRTVAKTSRGNYRTLNAFARLDPPDYDTLSSLLAKGKLWKIDSSDVTEQCAGDELYALEIVPIEGPKPLQLHFNACAADYNLLLEPQRTYFRKLLDWWERMRVKYRPSQPE